MQTFEQCRDGHNNSPDQQRPRPSDADEKRDSEIANEMVELPTKLGARGPFGRAESRDYKQDYNGRAANFCAGTKPRFHIGAQRNTLTPQDSTLGHKVAYYVYFEDEPGRRSAARLFTKDEARRIAAKQSLAEGTFNGEGEEMIRLMTTFLTLGISIATAAIANAQDGFFGNCNPNSTRCRLLNNPQQQTVSTQSHYGYAKHHHAKHHKAHAQ